jgi:hypothetical protein
VRRSRPTALDIEPERFEALGHQLVDRIADLLSSLPGSPVTLGEPPSGVRRALDAGAPLPLTGS